jgi:hypothetical protein
MRELDKKEEMMREGKVVKIEPMPKPAAPAVLDKTLEKAEVLSIKDHPHWDEALIQRMIADDPSILGLGPLLLRDKERIQPHRGRLDLLLQSEDATAWYEVEVQLGATDETHIIRTIEYWDVEHKRYPDLQHTAVIVAEDITSRFFNVINLFNQAIPIIALKMSAVKIGGQTALLFTNVLDYERKGLEAADEIAQPADRAYWESRASDATMKAMDRILQIARELNPKVEPKYRKGSISTIVGGSSGSFLTFRPRKKILKLGVFLPSAQDNDKLCEDAGFEVEYDPRYSKYRLVVRPEDVEKRAAFFRDFIRRSYEARSLAHEADIHGAP